MTIDHVGSAPYLPLPFALRVHETIERCASQNGMHIVIAHSQFGKTYACREIYLRERGAKVVGTPLIVPVGMSVFAGARRPRYWMRELMKSAGQGQLMRRVRISDDDLARAVERVGMRVLLFQQSHELSALELKDLITLHETCASNGHDLTIILFGVARTPLAKLTYGESISAQLEERLMSATEINGHLGKAEVTRGLRLMCEGWAPELVAAGLPEQWQRVIEILTRHDLARDEGIGSKRLEEVVRTVSALRTMEPNEKLTALIETAARTIRAGKQSAGVA